SPSPWAVAATAAMSEAGRPQREMASEIASAVASHKPSMSRSTWRGLGMICGTRRRATASGLPPSSKMTALVTVTPLSIPSRQGVSFSYRWLQDRCGVRLGARHRRNNDIDATRFHRLHLVRRRTAVDDDGVEVVQRTHGVQRTPFELGVVGKKDAHGRALEHCPF